MRDGRKNHGARIEKLRFRVVVSRTWSGAALAERAGMHKSWAVLVLVALGGCEFYFGDDDDPCKGLDYGSVGAPAYPNNQLRDPYTGQCAEYGYDYPCDDTCGGHCPPQPDVEYPDYGSCHSICDGLTETACIQSPGCFAAYADNPLADGPNVFKGCWQTAPSGPIHGMCSGNDAQQCSRHDDCSAVYIDSNSTLQFEECVPENGSGCDCAMGYHCEEACTGDPSAITCTTSCVEDLTCEAVDCGPGYTCAEVCEIDANGVSTCHPSCVVDQACEALATEDTCKARSDCTPVYDGQNCTCTLNGCSCEVLTYERCQTL
jgi:hypothetical protein